jgi:hypothetical protein
LSSRTFVDNTYSSNSRSIFTSETNCFILILDGRASIESQGCADPPLLAVASDDTTPLTFGHVVKEEVEKIQSAAESIDSSTKALTEKSEEEFQSDDKESRCGMQIGEESSDEEFEF